MQNRSVGKAGRDSGCFAGRYRLRKTGRCRFGGRKGLLLRGGLMRRAKPVELRKTGARTVDGKQPESGLKAGLRWRNCGTPRNLCIRADASQDQVSFAIGQQADQFSLPGNRKISADGCFHGRSGGQSRFTNIRRIHILRVGNPNGGLSVFFLSFQTVFRRSSWKRHC